MEIVRCWGWGLESGSPEKRKCLIFKIRSCTARSDLINKAFSADFVQDRILKIRVLASLGRFP